MTDKSLQACEDMAYRKQPADVIDARLARSSLRELLEQGKLQVKSKKGLRAVSGGRK